MHEQEQLDEELEASPKRASGNQLWGISFGSETPKKARPRLFSPMQSEIEDEFVRPEPVSAKELMKRHRKLVMGFSESDSDSDFRGSSASDSGSRPRPTKKRKRPSTSPPRMPPPSPLQSQFSISTVAWIPPGEENKQEQSLGDELRSAGLGAEDPVIPGMVRDVPANEPVNKRVRGRDTDWEAIEAAEPEKNPDAKWCALCKLTQRTVDIGADNPFLGDLRKHAFDNWAKIPPEEMGAQLQELWNTTLRPYATPENLRQPCHKQQMWRHFAYHDRTTYIQMEVDSEKYQKLVDRLFDEEEEEQALTSNPRKLSAFLKLQQMKERHNDKLEKLRPRNVL
jgi:hypothetical protein